MESTAALVSSKAPAPRDNRRVLTITYWSLLGLFSVAMLMDGLAGIMREQTGQDVMRHLGYPIYVMVIIGVAKLAGVLALWQPRFRTLTEWAYAGFTINFAGAFASWAFVDPNVSAFVPPLVMLAVLFTLYVVQKRFRQGKTA